MEAMAARSSGADVGGSGGGGLYFPSMKVDSETRQRTVNTEAIKLKFASSAWSARVLVWFRDAAG